jgi:hypothetical protein
MFSCRQAPVEGPRLQGARRREREIQIGFVLTGISSQKAVIILGTAKRTKNLVHVKKRQLPPIFDVRLLRSSGGETEDNLGKLRVTVTFYSCFI